MLPNLSLSSTSSYLQEYPSCERRLETRIVMIGIVLASRGLAPAPTSRAHVGAEEGGTHPDGLLEGEVVLEK